MFNVTSRCLICKIDFQLQFIINPLSACSIIPQGQKQASLGPPVRPRREVGAPVVRRPQVGDAQSHVRRRQRGGRPSGQAPAGRDHPGAGQAGKFG